MRVAEVLTVCECCLIWVANGDDSGCREYYGHTHPRYDNVEAAALDGGESEVWHRWACEGCHAEMLPGSVQYGVVILT